MRYNGLPVARDGWASVWEARFVRATLLPVRTPSLRRVFRDSDHAECKSGSIEETVRDRHLVTWEVSYGLSIRDISNDTATA